MTKSRWFLIALTLAGLMVAETAIAQVQAPFDPGIQHERAPGVPLAPRPLDVEQRLGETMTTPMPPPRSELSARPHQLAPERDPPMPKPVPSIMAP